MKDIMHDGSTFPTLEAIVDYILSPAAIDPKVLQRAIGEDLDPLTVALNNYPDVNTYYADKAGKEF